MIWFNFTFILDIIFVLAMSTNLKKEEEEFQKANIVGILL